MTLTVTLLSESGKTLIEGGEELLDRPGLKWIDVAAADETTLTRLGERFGLHKLALEDCLNLDQRPKLEEYPNHHFLVLHAFTARANDICELTLHELHTFIGADFVISVHEHDLPSMADARKRFHQDPSHTFGRGRDFVVYVLADSLIDMNFPLIDTINESVETLEEEIFDNVSPGQFEKVFAIKRAIVSLRRVISPQRDVVSLLTRPGGTFVGEKSSLYFRDIYDHLIRLNEQIDSARDLIANARDAYLSAVANRTNDITKQLTIFATIFLPLSFIVGFFGQNFDVLSQPVFFWLMLGVSAFVPIALLAWFKHKKWIF